MAKKIQAWAELGPRLEPTSPMSGEELIENIIAITNQSRGSVLAVLSELDVQIEAALKAGRIVHLPKLPPSLFKEGGNVVDASTALTGDSTIALIKRIPPGLRPYPGA